LEVRGRLVHVVKVSSREGSFTSFGGRGVDHYIIKVFLASVGERTPKTMAQRTAEALVLESTAADARLLKRYLMELIIKPSRVMKRA